jgi:hypothetical protein
MMLRTVLVALVFLAMSAGHELRAQSFLLRRAGGSFSAGYIGLQQVYDASTANREVFGRLNLNFTGYAVSPSALRFSLDFSPNVSSLSAAGFENIVGRGNILGLNFSGRITAFERGLASASLWAYRNDNKSLDPFGFRTEFDGSGYGVTLGFRMPALPMSVYYLNTERTQGLFRPAGLGSPNIFSTGRRELGWRANNSKLTARIRRTEDIFDGNTGTIFQETFLSHRLQWGRGSFLQSRFTRTNTRLANTGRTEVGPRISRSTLVWDQRALLRQARSLSTDLFYRLHRNSAGGFTSDGWAVGATERFRVGRPLSLFLSGVISGTNGAGFSSSYRSITPGLDVTIPLPAGVTLSAGAQVSLADTRSNLEGDVSIPVFGEPHTVDQSRSFLLEEAYVDPASVGVSSRDGSEVYEPDLDYRVIRVGQLTEISIPFGSRIDVGTTVSVDYRYAAPAVESEASSANTFYYGRIRSGSFEAYLRRSRRNSGNQLRDQPSGLGAERDQLTSGFRYGLFFSRYVTFNVFGEYHHNATAVESFRQYVGGASLSTQVMRGLAFGLSGSARGLTTSTGRERMAGSATLSGSWTPLPRVRVAGGLSYNLEQQTELRLRTQDTRFLGAYVNADWILGLTTLTLSYSYGTWDDMVLDWRNSRLYAEVRRAF